MQSAHSMPCVCTAPTACAAFEPTGMSTADSADNGSWQHGQAHAVSNIRPREESAMVTCAVTQQRRGGKPDAVVALASHPPASRQLCAVAIAPVWEGKWSALWIHWMARRSHRRSEARSGSVAI